MLLTFFPLCFIKAQNKIDTITCGSYKVIIEIPPLAYKHSKILDYEEGFWKIYPFSDSTYILLHYGSMINIPILGKRENCFEYKIYQLNNTCSTIRGSCTANIFFREDLYFYGNIILLYDNVSISKQIDFDIILDNIIIIKEE